MQSKLEENIKGILEEHTVDQSSLLIDNSSQVGKDFLIHQWKSLFPKTRILSYSDFKFGKAQEKLQEICSQGTDENILIKNISSSDFFRKISPPTSLSSQPRFIYHCIADAIPDNTDIKIIPWNTFSHSHFYTSSYDFRHHLIRGNNPDAYTALSIEDAQQKHHSFLEQFFQLWVSQKKIKLSKDILSEFLLLLTEQNSQILNKNLIAKTLSISPHTVQKLISNLESYGLISMVRPLTYKTHKRLAHTNKIFFNDSGLLCTLSGIQSWEALQSQPTLSHSFWTSFITEAIHSHFPDWKLFFYKDSSGAEVPLVMMKGLRRIAVHFPINAKAKLPKGLKTAAEDMEVECYWRICPDMEIHQHNANIHTGNFSHMEKWLKA